MTKLPTVGGDSGTWGTVLNDYLTESAFHTALSDSPSATDTTVDLAVAPPGLVAGSVILIDAYTSDAELRSVSSVSSETMTVSALNYDHAAGDTVLVIRDMTVTPEMYGCTSASSDNWSAIQRMVLEAAVLGVKVRDFNAINGQVWQVSAPICAKTSARWEDLGLKTHSTYGPADDAGALCMVAGFQWAFTASASTDKFTVSGGHGMTAGGFEETNHVKVVFNAPYGETLPGGITAGQVYYIKDVADSTTFTVSDTSGGDTLDITDDGAGYAWGSIEQLSRVYWDNVRFDVTVADVNGVRLAMQQPAYITNIRVEMSADATSRAYGVAVGGQIGYITNAEINPMGDNTTALALAGSGITITNLNLNGNGSSAVYGVEAACHAGTITNLWTESVKIGVKLTGENRGLAIDGMWLVTGSGTDRIALQVDSAAKDSSYSVCPIKWGTGGNHLLHDIGRGLDLYGSSYSTDETLEVGDSQGTYMGHVQEGRNRNDLAWKPPTIRHRTMISASGNYNLSYQDAGVISSAASADSTISLPTAVGWVGHTFVILHTSSSSHTCTVDPHGSETIDGSSTTTVAAGDSLTVMSDGTNWISV